MPKLDREGKAFKKIQGEKKQSQNSERKRAERTHTLIQLGGLIQKAGILEALEIRLGDDLQKNQQVKPVVEELLGGLSQLRGVFQEGDYSKALWREKGRSLLKRDKR